MAPAEGRELLERPSPDSTASPSEPRGALIALQVFVVLRFAVPAKLVFAPLGQIGSPATLWGLLCMAWYVTSVLWRGSGVHRGRQPIRWAFLTILVAWMLSYAVVPLRMADNFERQGAEAEMIQMLSVIGIGLLAADGLESRAQLLKLCRFICWVWGFSCAVALLQFAGINVIPWVTSLPGFRVTGDLASVQLRGTFNRAAGTTSHPIEFATVTAIVLPLAIQLQPWAHPRRRWTILTVVMVLSVAAALSRSGFLGLVVGLLVLGASWTRARRLKVAAMAVGIVLVLAIAMPDLLSTTTKLFTQATSDSSITTRTDDYAAVQPYIEARPLLGRGISTFMPPRYRILDNQYLLTLLEAGAVGLIALIGFVVISALTARDAWCHAPPGELRDASRAFFAAILVGAVSMAVFDGFAFDTFFGALFLFAGLGGAAWRLTRVPD